MWGVPSAAPVCPWVAPARRRGSPGATRHPTRYLLPAGLMFCCLAAAAEIHPSFFSVCLHLDSSQDRWRFVPADLMVPADFLDLPCFFAAALACALVASGTLVSLLSALFAAPLCPIVSLVSSSPSSLVHTAAAPRWPPRQRSPILNLNRTLNLREEHPASDCCPARPGGRDAVSVTVVRCPVGVGSPSSLLPYQHRRLSRWPSPQLGPHCRSTSPPCCPPRVRPLP